VFKCEGQVLKAAPPGETLLPNIHILKWSLTDELPCINTFFGPQIQCLELSIGCDNNLKALGSFLSQHSLDSLLHFDVRHISRRPVESLHAISNAICGWNQLRTLSAEELTPATFTHIATFPDLQSLVLTDICNSQAMVFPVFAFPTLERLDIKCKDVQFCIDLVKALSSCCLTSVRFGISLSDAKHLIDSLASTHAFHTSLRNITLYDPSNYTSRAPSGLGCGKAILSSLFVFSDLTSVNLTLHGLHDINDNVMETLSKTWPRLQYLSLYSNSPSWESPVMTLMCLIPLATFCSELEGLSLEFDARFDDALLEDYDSTCKCWAGVRNTSLRSLRVGMSPIDDCDICLVIRLLWDIFPNLKNLLYDYDDYEQSEFDLGWGEVDKELRQRRRRLHQ
jgi:hypothetical protein